MKNRGRVLTAMTGMSLWAGNTEPGRRTAKKPWHKRHLPKAARKGKTPEEIETLRKNLWEKGGKNEEQDGGSQQPPV
jgi:hypothetical protein